MPSKKTSRARRALRVAFVLAVLLPCPFVAHAEAPAEVARSPDAASPADVNPAVPPPATPDALTPPRLLESSQPSLPALAVGSEPASVVLELTIDKDGSARDAVVLASGGERADQAALAAVSQLRFEPARRGEQPIVARIPFRFDLEPAAPPPPPPAAVNPVEAPRDGEELSDGLTLDVQGQRPPRETTVHAIAMDESRTMPGTNGDPLRAVESLPGVARPSAVEAQLIVRGAAPNDSAIFIDGIRIPLAYHFGGVSSVVQNDALDKLEFRPGNFGAEYGRAMGGVVELGLRSPRRDRLGGVAQLDTFDGRLMLEGPLGKRTRFMVAARRSWVDAWIGSLDEDIKAAPVYYDGQAMLEHDLTRRTTVRLWFVGSDDRIKLLFDDPDPGDPAEGGALEIGTGFTRLALHIDSKLTDDTKLRHTFSWGTDRFDIKAGRSFQDITANTLDYRGEVRTHFSRWLSGAVGIDANFWRYDVKIRVPPYEATDEVDSPAFARPQRQMSADVWLVRPAMYAMLELTPSEGLRIVPSVRADYAQDTEQLTLDPRVSARADVHPGFPRTTLKGGVGFYSQPPQGVESVRPFGTKGLDSNRALHASFGVEQELARGLELSIEGYFKQLSKLVIARKSETEDAVGASFANTGSGRVYGGETLLRYRDPSGRYFGWLAYTLSRSERRNDNSESYHPFQYDQTHILTALANVKLGRGWSTGFRFRYVTGSPYTPYVGGVVDLDAGAYAAIPGRPYGARIPAFHQLDLRVDKTWELGRTKLTAYCEVRNTYNRKNAESLNYRYDYSKYEVASGLPIVPVIGLRGEL